MSVWLRKLNRKIKRSGWWFVILIALRIIEDRLAGSTNTWIDGHSGDFVLFIKRIIDWSAHDTLGIAGILLVGTFILFMVLSYRETAKVNAKKHEAIGGHVTGKPIPTEQPKNYKPSRVPIVMEFNPDNGHYFHQEDRPSDVSVVTERYREYYCTMFNDSDETLRNVSCEVERIITIKNRPNDVEIHPENVHDKLRYDVPPTFPVTMPVSARGREKIWLFSRLERALGNEPIRIVKGSKFFHDKKRLRKVFLRVTAENYLPKTFSVDVWVEDGLLRMTWIQPEQDL